MGILEIITNADVYLNDLIFQYGEWVYFILFVIIFCETGLVIFPFLPGDALIFTAGILAASGNLDPVTLIAVMTSAAIFGNTTNYFLGRNLGKKIISKGIIKPKHFKEAETMFEKFGKKAIILCRFMPYVRSFVPFLAGITRLNKRIYFIYTLVGAILWVGSFTCVGYFLGHNLFIQSHFQYIVYAMMISSWIPLVISFIKYYKRRYISLKPSIKQ